MLLAYLMHAASNFWPRVLPMGAMVEPFAWLPDAITILAIVLVVLIYGPTHLSRKPITELPIALASEQPLGELRIIEENAR